MIVCSAKSFYSIMQHYLFFQKFESVHRVLLRSGQTSDKIGGQYGREDYGLFPLTTEDLP
jgi:hypothetical protein